MDTLGQTTREMVPLSFVIIEERAFFIGLF